MKNPIYIRTVNKKTFHHCIDVNEKGQVIIDVAEDGSIIGVEFLVDVEIESDEPIKTTT